MDVTLVIIKAIFTLAACYATVKFLQYVMDEFL